MKVTHSMMLANIMLVCIMSVCHCASAPSKPTDVTKAQSECLANLGAKELECTHLFSTKPEIDACLAKESATDCHDAGAAK